MFGHVPDAANGIDERRRNTAAGLASSLRLAGTGTQEPLWDRLGELTLPVLVVVGGRDTKFTDLGRRLVAGVGGPRHPRRGRGRRPRPAPATAGRGGGGVRAFLAD